MVAGSTAGSSIRQIGDSPVATRTLGRGDNGDGGQGAGVIGASPAGSAVAEGEKILAGGADPSGVGGGDAARSRAEV